MSFLYLIEMLLDNHLNKEIWITIDGLVSEEFIKTWKKIIFHIINTKYLNYIILKTKEVLVT